jgi:transcriptional regulator with XRE-family HTH domain
MKDKLKKSLALKIKALRESASITQEELAYKCDVSWRTISNLERALVVPDLIMLYKISQIFNVSIDSLLDVNIDNNKSRSRLDKEQYITEKIKYVNDKTLDYILDELILLFKHFN